MLSDECQVDLGEQCIGVDVATTGEWIPSAAAGEQARGVGIPQGNPVFGPQRGSLVFNRGDELLACGSVGSVRDFGCACGEELLLLQLDAFPGWVAEDAGAAAGTQVRELQR